MVIAFKHQEHQHQAFTGNSVGPNPVLCVCSNATAQALLDVLSSGNRNSELHITPGKGLLRVVLHLEYILLTWFGICEDLEGVWGLCKY